MHIIGPKPYKELPAYLAMFDTAIIPFKNNELTAYVNPLKLMEYFAAQKPVVASGLPECNRFNKNMYIAESYEKFLSCIDAAISRPSNQMIKSAQEVALSKTWNKKAEKLSAIILEGIKRNEKDKSNYSFRNSAGSN